MTPTALEQTVRLVLAQQAKLVQPVEATPAQADLFDLGMDSHAAVRVMLALEERLGVEFPNDRLTRATFSTVDAIVQALSECELAG